MKAMASDFDGTFYFMGEEEVIRKQDLEAIRSFQKKGNLFGVCSGRSLRGITDIIPEISFDFYIMASGAFVLDRDFHVLSKTCISYDVMTSIYWKYEKDLFIIIHANDTVYSLQQDLPLLIYVRDMEEMREADIYGLSFGTSSPDEAWRVAEEVNMDYGDSVIAYANVKNVDIVSRDCSKGKALAMIRDFYGIDCLAGIGDSHNDIPMLQEADLAYTFPYSPEAAKKEADYIVDNLAQAIAIFQEE